MVTLSHSERLIPPKLTLKGTIQPPHSVRLVPLDLSTKQCSIDANVAAIAEPSSERIALS